MNLKRYGTLAGTLAALWWAAGSLGAQSLADMRAEFEALKREYETRMAEMQARIEELEEKAEETDEALDEVFAPDFMEEGLPAKVTQNLEFHGYLRAGFIFNQNGRSILNAGEELVHPDGLFEIGWRLGNEADTYGELTFIYHVPTSKDSAQFEVVNTLAFKYQSDKNNYTTDDASGVDLLFREAYVRATNVFQSRPEMAFWAGQRFYDRHDIHINDFYFLDMSGYGGGVENIKLGPGNLNVAYIGGSQDDLVVENGIGTEHHLDIRYKGLKVFGGELMIWGDLAWLKGGQPGSDGETDNLGWAVGLVHSRPLNAGSFITGGYTKNSIMYGRGNASDFNAYVLDWRNIDQIEESETWLATSQTVLQFTERFSAMVAAVWQYSVLGDGIGASGDERHYVSAGVRPIYMITDHFGIQGEVGADWVDDIRWTSEDDSGTMYKFTVAPTIKANGSFFGRPEIRVFATYATWEDMPSWFTPAGVDSGETNAWLFGIQAETWW